MSSFWSKVAVCFCYTIFHGHLVHSWTLLPSWHACVKPTCCRGHVARHWHCPGCVDSKDVALFSFLNLLRWEWCTLLQKLALGCKYWYGVGVLKSLASVSAHYIMSSPHGYGEQLTALLSSLQKSFTYLRLVILFPQRPLFSMLNNCLSFSLSSCYFQIEWHMLILHLEIPFIPLCNVLWSVLCWGPLGSLHLVWALFEALCLRMSPILQLRPFLTEKSSRVISCTLCVTLLSAHTCITMLGFGTIFIVHAYTFGYSFPTRCVFSPYGILSRLFIFLIF